MTTHSAAQSMSAHRHALCVGIGKYTHIPNRDLRYAVDDAKAMYHIFADPARGDFTAKLLIEPEQTTGDALIDEIHDILRPPDPNDLVVIYFSCHGEVYNGRTFCLLPSDAELEPDGELNNTSVLDIFDLAKQFSSARAKNIIMLLDVCYSGGAEDIFLHRLFSDNDPDGSKYIIGAALRTRPTRQSSAAGHGIFTAALLDTFQQKPYNATEWLTIMQIIDALPDAIQRYWRGEIERIRSISYASDPRLPLVKNPRYAQASTEFAAEVERLLEIRAYRKEDMRPPQDAPANFFFTTVESGLEPINVGILPIYNEVVALTEEEAQRIAAFIQSQVEQRNIHLGMVVLAQDEANNALRKYSGHWLRIRTHKSIQNDLINFQAYLRDVLLAKYERSATDDSPPLAEVYIPLNATEYATRKLIDIEQAVRQWLADGTSTRLAILADYGSGKSTFCTYLAAALAREHLEERKHRGFSNTRIPLLIPLKKFNLAHCDLKDYIINYLSEEYNIESARREKLLRMAEGGQLLFLFDGFDEMASKATAETLEVNIEYIEQLAHGKNKVLVTTRQEYLINLAEEQDIFQHYQRFSLEPFDISQTELYVQKRVRFIRTERDEPLPDWRIYWQRMNSIPNLSDLQLRPVFLEMIIQTLPEFFRERTVQKSTSLYYLYIHKELRRRPTPTSLQGHLGVGKRFEIMQRIALEFYQKNSAGLSISQIDLITRDLLTQEQQKEMEVWLREIVSYSLLRRRDDTYWFSHESFMEYLIACQLAKAIQDDRRELFELKIISKAIKGFLIELEEGYAQKNDQQPHYQKATLVRWFRSQPKQKIFSANIFSLLASILAREEMQTLPLEDANLDEADLSHAQLPQAQFKGIHLNKGYLEGVNLQNANLVSATLRSANLKEANLEDAKLSNASLDKAYLTGASLKNANLASISLKEAHLEGANLMKAELSISHLEGAYLQGANLEGANLWNAKLQGANLEGADLWSANLQDANLEGAILRNARLEGVLHLDKAKLKGADLTGVTLPDTKP
ncbi:MAG TPA: pentapeptide repeat-containing protein [Ktedonobacteraceae bacterium]|nr:pentapeptide repeat-containing protein [Ktedonobacteraceae bacterium]